jgi:hypothetical protein
MEKKGKEILDEVIARQPRRPRDARPPVPQRSGPQPRGARGVPGPGLPDPVDALAPEERRPHAAAVRRRRGQGPDRAPARHHRRVARELLDQLGAEGVGGQVRVAPPATSRCSICRASSAATTRRPTASSTASSAPAGKAYSALHDIDANKPSGSIKIRVKTYAHTLMLLREKLEDQADKKLVLERALTEKKLELMYARCTDKLEPRAARSALATQTRARGRGGVVAARRAEEALRATSRSPSSRCLGTRRRWCDRRLEQPRPVQRRAPRTPSHAQRSDAALAAPIPIRLHLTPPPLPRPDT